MLKFIQDIKNQGFMRLWLAQLISQFGERLNQMALIGLISERSPGSTLDLAILLSFTIIPVFIVGPIAGVYVDRWNRRRTLFVSDIFKGLLVLTIPLMLMERPSMFPIYGVVFLIFCLSRIYIPAKMSIIPQLVTKENLLMANSLMTTTGMIAFVLGCALGGFLVDQVGAKGGLIGNAMTFFISAMLIISIREDWHFHLNRTKILNTGKELIRIEKSIITEIKEGFDYLIQHKEIRFVINMLFILFAAAGAVYVVIIIFIQQTFQSVTKDLGVLAVCLGIGLFLGALGYGKWGKRIAWYITIFLCLVTGGGMIILFAMIVYYYPNLAVAGLLAFVLGIILGPIFIAANTIVHFVSDEKMRGKVFSALEVVSHFAFLLAMLLSSFLSEFVHRLWILVGVGVIFSLVGGIGFVRYLKKRDLAFPTEKMA